MPREKKWAIWSLDERSGRWVQVDEGLDEATAERRVGSRADTAKRLDLRAEYVALPHGQTPEPREPQPDADTGGRYLPAVKVGGAPATDPLAETLEALAKLSALINTLRIVRSNDTFVMEIADKADEVFAPFMAKDQGGL